MAFLGRAKKEVLRVLAEELGEEVNSELKVVELKNLILGSKNYEEEFVKELLASLLEERTQKEEQERLERERAHELERTRLELAANSSERPDSPVELNYDYKVDLHKIIPKFNQKEDDISLFLVLFERQAKILRVPKERLVTQLIGVLPSDIAKIIAREREEVAQDYNYVKSLLLKRFKLSPERFRQMFVKHQKSSEETWHDFYYEIKNYFEGWLAGLQIETFDQLKDLMIADQIKKKAPLEFKEHYLDDWTAIHCPAKLAEKIEEFEDIRRTIKGKQPGFPQKKPEEKWRSRPPNDNKLYNERRNNPWSPRNGRREENNDRMVQRAFERRKPLQCYECGSPDHLRPQCPKVRSTSTVNRVREKSEDMLLSPYTIVGKVNGIEMPILRDTGATVDVICQKHVKPKMMTGEHVWIQHLLEEKQVCLPLAEVEIESEMGHVITKAAVIGNHLDQGRYLLGNHTASLLANIKEDSWINPEIVSVVQTRAQQRKKQAEEKGNYANLEETEKEHVVNISADEEKENNGETDEKFLLPLVEKDEPIMDLVKMDSKKFVEAQRKSKELEPCFKEINEAESKEGSHYALLKEGTLVRKKLDKTGKERILLVVPEEFREQIKRMCHEGTSCHLGVTKTKDRLVKYFFWPKCYKEIEEFVKTCDACQLAGKAQDKKKAPLKLVPVIQEIFTKLNVDACGPLPMTPNGNKYIITAMCVSSKYPEAIPVPDIKSPSVVDALLKIFSRMGFPKEIQMDQGTSFMSALTVEFLDRFGIKITRSSVYHPQSNPVERFHRTLKRILRVLCLEAASEWEKQLPPILFALRTVTHESTGFTPSELVHGKNLRTPMTLLYEKWVELPEEENYVTEYVFELINRMKRCQELAIVNMEVTQQKRKSWYDRNAIKREFQEGDLVLVLAIGRPNKLSAQWKGPGRIEKKVSETNYVVSFEGKKERNQVYHVNMLKPYHKRPDFVNVMSCLENGDANELEMNFPVIEKDPNVFDFSDIKENDALEQRLDDEQIRELQQLLCRYSNLFSNVPGRTQLVEHDIDLVNDTPVRMKAYRMSPRQNDILKSEIQKMLQYKIIEVGESDYTSPMILVEAPEREPRPCIDYRRLNEVTRTQYYPIPNIEQRVETVAAAKFITVLDLTKGYWQIPLSTRAQRLAAFTTSFGTYRPLRMPFGLKNAPYYFSKMMADLLQGLESYAVPYLDDVAIFSHKWEDHIRHLEEVLVRIKNANLTIKPSKCKFAQDSVPYLGHIVGRGKRSPTDLKVKVIQEFPTPSTKTDIRAFLGLAGYYRQYIPMFSALSAPLTDTLKGKVRKGKIDWTEQCERAFRNLKEKLATKPILYAPDFNQTFILQTDASDTGMGIVLAQQDKDGQEHPILYLSKKFTDVEKRYCTTEKECAAIVYAVRKLQCYLDGQTQFIIQTDHNPLVWLRSNAGTNPRLMRWTLALQPFNYKVVYKKGKEHLNADCLSRFFPPLPEKDSNNS